MDAVTADRIQALIRRLCPLYEHIDLRVDRVGDLLVCTVPLDEGNGNHLGGMHAAVQWAAAEALGGIAYAAHPELGRCRVAVRNVAIDFLALAKTDVVASAAFDPTAVADVRRQLTEHGKAEYDLDITLCDSAGGTVATATGRYYLRSLEALQPP